MLETYLTYIQDQDNAAKVQWDRVKDAIKKGTGRVLDKDVISRMGPSMKMHYAKKNDIKKSEKSYNKYRDNKKEIPTDDSGIYNLK